MEEVLEDSQALVDGRCMMGELVCGVFALQGDDETSRFWVWFVLLISSFLGESDDGQDGS